MCENAEPGGITSASAASRSARDVSVAASTYPAVGVAKALRLVTQ